MENKEPKELNKLLIIGNGFDLAHGLKTSYPDFMLWVLRTEFENIYLKKKSFDIIEMNSGFSDDVKTFDFLDKSIEDYLQILISKKRETSLFVSVKNILFKHLLEKQYLQNWVDIENEYYLQLVKTFTTKSNVVKPLGVKKIEDLNSDFEQIKQLLEKYLISIKDVPFRTDAKISTFFNQLPKQDKMKTIYPALVCNFNYTSTLDKYIRENSDMKYDDICFIHGEIERKINPIVFGYGDEKEDNYLPIENSKEDSYLKYIKSFAYLKTPYYSKLLSFIDAEKYEVIIMGHSFGQSERVLLKTIFEHENCHEIIIKYYKRPDGTDDFDEKAKEIARSFTDKALFRKRVVHYQDERVTSLAY